MASASPCAPRWLLVSPRAGLLRSGSVVERPGHVQRWTISLLILLTLLVGPNGLLTSLSILVPTGHVMPQTATSSLTPMTQAQALANQAHAWGHQTLPDIQPPGSYEAAGTAAPSAIPRQVRSSTPVIVAQIPLKGTVGTTVVTRDQRFSITVPARALPSQELAHAGGPVILRITQLSGSMGGGASGWVSLGTYRLEVLGPDGPIRGLAFAQPVTFQLHYTPAEALAIVPTAIKLSLVSELPKGLLQEPSPRRRPCAQPRNSSRSRAWRRPTRSVSRRPWRRW